MASINKVILICTLGREPELKQTQGGTAFCNLSAATSRKYKDAQGEYQEETEWHRVSLFGKVAELACQYLHKGSSVYIEGRLHTRKFTDKQGIERYQTEIIGESMQFLSSGKKQESSSDVRSSNLRRVSDDCPF